MLLHASEWDPLFRNLDPPLQYSSAASLLLVDPHQNNGTAHPTYHLKKRRFIASYVQPIIQQYKSQLFKRTKVATIDDFHKELKPSRAYHNINTFCGKQR